MKNLTTKLVKVMANVKRVAKNGKNNFQNYSYVTEADILDAVRDELSAQNVFIYSSVEGSHKEGNLTSVIMKHTLVDGDSGESFEVKSFGQGSDNQDKGGPKAITSSTKYFLLKMFMIPTGDDPEATDETGKRTSGTTKTTKPADLQGSQNTVPEKVASYGFSKRPKAVVTTGADDAGF